MTARPWFKFYPSDFLGDSRVVGMSPAARGVYITLLCCQWQLGELPSEERELRKLAGGQMPLARWREVWSQVGPCFVKNDHGMYANPRLCLVRQNADMAKAKRRRAGLAGAKARWQSHANANGNHRSQIPDTRIAPDGAPAPKARPRRRRASGEHQELIEHWCETWERIRGEKYAFEGAKDGAAVKRCLKYADGNARLVRERMSRLLEDPPDAWLAQNASLSILAGKWNSLGGKVARNGNAPTQRRMDDLMERL